MRFVRLCSVGWVDFSRGALLSLIAAVTVLGLVLSSPSMTSAQSPAPTTCAISAAEAPVFYVTDRSALTGRAQYDRGYDKVDNSVVSYGRAQLTGQAGLDAANIGVSGTIPCGSRADFFTALAQRVPVGGGVMIFITGFHEEFKDEVADAATFQQQTSFKGPVIAFSWPTAQTILYPNDEANENWAEHDLKALLLAYHALPSLALLPITFVSHSLGARLAAVGITTVNPWQCGTASCLAGAVMFASDIDTYALRNMFDDLNPGSCDSPTEAAKVHRFIEYVSNGDAALEASREAHGHSRAGNINHKLIPLLGLEPNGRDEIFLCSTVDTIDVSHYTSSPGQSLVKKATGHFYYQNPVVLRDLLLSWSGVKPGSPPRNLTPLSTPKSPPLTFQIPAGR